MGNIENDRGDCARCYGKGEIMFGPVAETCLQCDGTGIDIDDAGRREINDRAGDLHYAMVEVGLLERDSMNHAVRNLIVRALARTYRNRGA